MACIASVGEATRILAIRHGQTAWNADARIQGHTDIALDSLGEWQAERLAHALGADELQAIYSSDLSRARCTAAQGVDIEVFLTMAAAFSSECAGLTW